MQFETVVIYDNDEPVGVIYGQNSELLKTLQKTEYWEHIQEYIDENEEEEPVDINALQDMLSNVDLEFDSGYPIKIKIFENQSYSGSKKRKLKK